MDVQPINFERIRSVSDHITTVLPTNDRLTLCAFHLDCVSLLPTRGIAIDLCDPWHVELRDTPLFWGVDAIDKCRIHACVNGLEIVLKVILARGKYFMDAGCRTYKLGKPDERWLQWLKKQRIKVPWAAPFGVIL